ncbi:MAG: gliding motility lipoprotein GldD [Flavobacteriaceae bacterium]|nr:MAG: gliding motility lipoprotein GldD [Flavobacteriaceae bacterium]
MISVKNLFLALSLILFCQCNNNPTPKPKGYVRVDFPVAVYQNYSESFLPFEFEKSKLANLEKAKKQNWYNLLYPELNATVFLTYYKVEGNLPKLIQDSETLAYKHLIKASAIVPKSFENPSNKTYGKLYQIKGDVASNLQFYLTDSTKHFLSGSLYFKANPNADSLSPSVDYLKKDLVVLMESLRWGK